LPRRVEAGDFDEATWAASQARSKILDRLAMKKELSKSEMDAAAWELGVSRAQCYRLLRRYRQDPTVMGVAPRRRGRAVGAKLLAPAVEAVIEDAIDQFYLVPEAPTLARLVREIERRCAAAALKAPAYNSVRARVRSKDARVVLRRRKGPAYAHAKAGLIVGHLEADGPLSLVQIDHTQADVVVVAEGTRMPIKRPWLTLAIDVATRMAAGFYVSLDPPSAVAVAMVMSRAVMSKEEYLKGRGVNVAWPVSGIPD